MKKVLKISDLIKHWCVGKVSNNSRWKYRNNIASIEGSTLLGHIGCSTLDLTIVIGIACHSAISVIQAAAMDNANIELEECL